MDLIDLVGETRTESLPPGFLRSLKVKYKHEASHVFPPGTPWKGKAKPSSPLEKSCEARQQRTGSGARSVASNLSTPSFMSWKVPSRLIHKYKTEKALEDPDVNVTKLSKLDLSEREALHSRMSAGSNRSLGSVRSAASLLNEQKREHLPRLEPAGHRASLVTPMASPHKGLLNRDRATPARQALPGVDTWLKTASRQEKAVVSKVLGVADAELFHKAAGKVAQPKAVEAVEKWLTTANDTEREIAIKFFSNLAGTKLDVGGTDIKGHRDHTEGTCNACDSGKIEKALDALVSGSAVASRSRLLYNPSRAPNVSKSSYYQRAAGRLPTSVRQQFQTWHHLPVYAEHSAAAVPNKSSMFVQPHKYYGRHFTIHPEWGFHKPPALK